MTIETKRPKQVSSTRVTIAQIIRSEEFKGGVNDVRWGHQPRYDHPIAEDWNYERGRLWARVAPMRMPLRVDGRVNPEAARLLKRLFEEGAII